MGSPVWKWKRLKNVRTKWAYRAANGPVWMPQALKLLSLIHIGRWEILSPLVYEGRALIKCTRLLDWLFPIEYLIFRGHMKALNILFHLRCDSLFNSDKWLYGSPKCWATLLNPSPTQVKTVSKTAVLWVAGNKECLYILTCHLVISQSSASYHTSFERGKSGLFADKKKSLLSNK